MFKFFKHGTERTVNVIISKGEDCGVMKKAIGELTNVVNNNAKVMNNVRAGVAGCVIALGIGLLLHNKLLTELDERVAKLEHKQATEENQEN